MRDGRPVLHVSTIVSQKCIRYLLKIKKNKHYCQWKSVESQITITKLMLSKYLKKKKTNR